MVCNFSVKLWCRFVSLFDRTGGGLKMQVNVGDACVIQRRVMCVCNVMTCDVRVITFVCVVRVMWWCVCVMCV